MLEAIIERISQHNNTQSAISFFYLYNSKKTPLLSCYALENIHTKLSVGTHLAKWEIPKNNLWYKKKKDTPTLMVDNKIYFGNYCNGIISENCISLGNVLDGNGYIYDKAHILNKFFDLVGENSLNIVIKDLI